MESKRVVVLVLFSVLLLAGFLFYLLVFNKENIQGRVISGRDEHGCLIHEGFTWNETERACVKEWVSGVGRYQNSTRFVNLSYGNETANWTTNFSITRNSLGLGKINVTNSSNEINLTSMAS